MSLIKKLAGGNQSTGNLKTWILGAAICGVFSAVPAQAALSLVVTEPGYPPAFGTVGPGNTITLTGPYGDFNTNIVIGYSNSNTPTSVAELQVQTLQVINNANTGTKTLTVSLTDSAYNFPGAPGQTLRMTSSLGGTFTAPMAGDKVTFQSTATPMGGPVLSTSTALQSYTSPSSYAGAVGFSVPDQTATFISTGSYSLSNQLTLSLSNSGEAVNLSGSTTVAAVPEPTGGAVIAVAALGLLRRRRRAV